MDKFLKNLREKIKVKTSGIKDLKKLVLLGIIGMMLIFFSSFFQDSEKEEKQKQDKKYQMSDYAEYLERQVEGILGEIDGVGDVSVMLTVSGTEEYVYAQENRESISSGSDNSSSQNENSYIFEQKDGDKTALVKKVVNPDVSGVVIVCDGGNSPSVREKIFEAVSVSLGVPANRIFVAASDKK